MIKLLVLFGGQSTEHEISCLSAYSVLKNVDRDRFEVRATGITREGDFIPADGIPLEDIRDGSWKKLRTEETSGIAAGLESLRWADVVFPVMHGIMAEDGTVQGLLSVLEKPFVGPGVLSSALCMDKAYAKMILREYGLPVVEGVAVDRSELDDIASVKEKIIAAAGMPCFIKPSNSGSSVGASLVAAEEDLEAAVRNAAQYDRRILAERYVKGKEVECAVLGNDDPVAAVPGEIVSTADFYDYDDKYVNGTSSTRIPADVPEDALRKIRGLAVKAFKALDCKGLARVDFFYEPSTGRISVNELNTIPGFTEISMYSKMWEHEGVPMKELITRLVELGIENYRANRRKVE